jgi:micrococcal nuclease
MVAGCQAAAAVRLPVSATPPATARESLRETAPTGRPTPEPKATPSAAGATSSGYPDVPTSTATIGTEPTGPTQDAVVVRVVDGDTIRVELDGTEYALRYIGMDTPETVNPNQPVEWMGKEASDANKRLVTGRAVVLERDVSETDRYGRLLRYVWLHDSNGWLLVNGELVRLGFAQVYTYPPDVKYNELFLSLERSAREADLGLWGQPPDETSPPANVTASPTDGNQTGCDPAYPTVCIPPAPPDLDCGDVPFNDFQVLAPDPHRFDGNHDGVGCES